MYETGMLIELAPTDTPKQFAFTSVLDTVAQLTMLTASLFVDKPAERRPPDKSS